MKLECFNLQRKQQDFNILTVNFSCIQLATTVLYKNSCVFACEDFPQENQMQQIRNYLCLSTNVAIIFIHCYLLAFFRSAWFSALAKTYSFAIFGLCVGFSELQMCMALCVGFYIPLINSFALSNVNAASTSFLSKIIK